MKGIIKVRSFDSLKKLNYKRAKGKRKNIIEFNNSIHRTIITLEKLCMLTPELLWELIERRRYLYIEAGKLEWVMQSKKKKLNLFSEDITKYVNNLSSTYLAILRVPYEIRIIDKYKNYIYKREKEESEKVV
jgi:hypothetical protein